MTNELTFIDLRTEASADLISRAYNDLLAPAFDADELDSLEVVTNGLATSGSGATWGLCALDDHKPAGCVLAYPFKKSGVLLLGYIAVAAGGRDRGIGGKLIVEAQRRWLGKSDMTLLLGEVEDPRRYAAQGGIDPTRRVMFYARLGVEVIVGPYFQPRLAADKERVHNLFLSVLGRTDTTDHAVAGKQISTFLIEYFTGSGEGADWPHPDDAEGKELLDWYDQHESVPLCPIGDYPQLTIPPAGVLSPADWAKVKKEFRQRSIDTVRQRLIDAAIITGSRSADIQADSAESDDKIAALGDELGRTDPWIASLKTYRGTAILAYLVFAWGMAMWELTGDHQQVRKNIIKAVDAYDLAILESAKSSEPRIVPSSRILVEFILHQLASRQRSGVHDETMMWESRSLLFDAMSVESSVYSGSAVAAQKQAGSIVQNAKQLKTELRTMINTDDDLIGLLENILDDHVTYYSAITDAAAALQSAEAKDPDADQLLTNAILKVASTQQALLDSGDVLASELSAYHIVLQSWRRRLILDPAEVQLDSINIIYLYPFTLPDITGDTAQQTVLRYAYSHSQSNSPVFGRVKPSGAPHLVDLSDLWTWGGRGKCLQRSIALPLSDIELHIPGEDASNYVYSADIRFNELGNHYLRLEVKLQDGVPLSNLNQALRRATSYAGQQYITAAGYPNTAWTSIAEYAEDVILGVGRWIIETSNATYDPERNPMMFQSDLDYHVIVAIRRATTAGQSGEPPRLASRKEILDDYGPLLAQPLNREVTALDEWTCWSTAETNPNLLGDVHLPGDFAIGTEHSTILCMLSTPDWSHCGYQEVAEFVGSLPTLIRRWKIDFDYHIELTDELLMDEDAGEKVEVFEEKLNGARSQLRAKISTIRNQQFYLIPSRLVSLSAERTFLANLYNLTNIPKGTDDIDSYLKRGDIAIERITTREERLRAHLVESFQNRMQWTLFLVSLFSFSSVIALILQLAYGAEIPGWPSLSKDEGHHGRFDVELSAAIYITVSVGLLLFLWWSRNKFMLKRIVRRSKKTDDSTDQSAHD